MACKTTQKGHLKKMRLSLTLPVEPMVPINCPIWDRTFFMYRSEDILFLKMIMPTIGTPTSLRLDDFVVNTSQGFFLANSEKDSGRWTPLEPLKRNQSCPRLLTMLVFISKLVVTTALFLQLTVVDAVEESFVLEPDLEPGLRGLVENVTISSFYKKYKHYPLYCATPDQMKKRSIPPLKDFLPNSGNANNKVSPIGETRLVHVTAVVRHGARTPWSSEMKCWKGYWESKDTGKWDCDDLTTFLTTPSREGTSSEIESKELFLFEKQYNALHFPKDKLANVLNGTCQMGQLIQQGYDQEVTNGMILREAYTYRKGEYDHDERMRLLDLSETTNDDTLPWKRLTFRADDYQRTVMSGQIVLRSLFDPELQAYKAAHPDNDIIIPLHIADEVNDVLDANENGCPKLREVKKIAQQSKEYLAFNYSQFSRDVRDYMQTKLGMDEDASPLDCLMCTICTDRPLPPAVDDYNGTTKNWFTRLTEYEIQKNTLVMLHNNSEYAKLSMGPLWYEIMANINPNLAEVPSAPKLSLIAGHDTTLMPLLASLGPNLWKATDWPPYASMMLIEIHELIDGRSDTNVYTSKFAFRLLFNGKILTPLVEGCHEDCELCDIVHLKAIVDPIAIREPDCSVVDPTTNEVATGIFHGAEPVVSHGLVLIVTLLLLSGFGGSVVTVFFMRRPLTRRTMDNKNSMDGEHGVELSAGGIFRD